MQAALAALTRRRRRSGGRAWQICWRWPSTLRAPRRLSARSPTRWRRSSAATRPRSAPSQASTATRSGRTTQDRIAEVARRGARRSPRPTAAGRASWSPRWARTATTAARRSSPPAFADLGFDVDVGPLFQTPDEAARQAVENDVHVVGVVLAGRRPPDAGAGAARGARPSWGARDIMIVVGGVIPPRRLRRAVRAPVPRPSSGPGR